MARYEQVLKNTYDSLDALIPIHVVASALLKDTVTLKYYAQLKLRNDTEYVAEKVTVIVIPYDAEGNKIAGEKTYTYSNLNITPQMEFGSKEAISFDVEGVSSFQPMVKSVSFSNGLEWVAGQVLDDIKSEKNSMILDDIHSSFESGDYKKAINLVDTLIDTEINKDLIKNDLYTKSIDIARDNISKESYTAAEKALNIVPDVHEEKEGLLKDLNAGKIEDCVKEKKSMLRLIKIVGIIAVLVAIAFFAYQAYHKAHSLPFTVDDYYETADNYMEKYGEDNGFSPGHEYGATSYFVDHCWMDYFGTGDGHSEFVVIPSGDSYDILRYIIVFVPERNMDKAIKKLARVYDFDASSLHVDDEEETEINADEVIITVLPGYDEGVNGSDSENKYGAIVIVSKD